MTYCGIYVQQIAQKPEHIGVQLLIFVQDENKDDSADWCW